MSATTDAWRLGGFLALAACVALPDGACRAARDGGAPAGASAAETARAASRHASELQRAFEERAAEVRNDLDAARRSADAFLSSRAGPTRRQAEAVREKAWRALRRGEAVLGQAAEDGSRVAENWARVIQDRMMRLEETLQSLTGAAGHADS